MLNREVRLAMRKVVMLSAESSPLVVRGWYLESAYFHPRYPDWMKVRDMPEDWKRALEFIRARAREYYERMPPP